MLRLQVAKGKECFLGNKYDVKYGMEKRGTMCDAGVSDENKLHSSKGEMPTGMVLWADYMEEELNMKHNKMTIMN